MLLYNNTYLPVQDLKLSYTNRAFQYNDGFFETIMVVDGRLRFWWEHKARMQEAASALQLVMPDYFWDGELEDNLLQLTKQRNAIKLGRLKLKVWRAGRGLYTPETNEIEWLATAETTRSIPEAAMEIGICQSVRTVYSSLSHFKGPHAPLYVLAGIEKQATGLEDMLLLDASGHVAELISSSIFWMKEGVLYTPSLKTGCVNGILRRNILSWSQRQGIAVQECLASPKELMQADCVFGANVTGIRGVNRMAEAQLNTDEAFLSELKSDLQV